MLDTGYLYAKDKNRIFINTCLGCIGACSYCYLPKIGYRNNQQSSKIRTAKQILDDIKNIGYKIDSDTLITLGCFSECWDEQNKPQTVELIKHFLSQGNQVQLSTKKEIALEEVMHFQELIQYLGQLVIFVSSASISEWNKFEKNTDNPNNRFKTFNISNKLNIPTVLYMKPILQGITIKDIDLYKQVINAYHVKDVVVGSMYSEQKAEETVHFSDRNQLFYNPVSDEIVIKSSLIGICNVYSRSSQVMQTYKKRFKDFEER